jgi:hypothetical protein
VALDTVAGPRSGSEQEAQQLLRARVAELRSESYEALGARRDIDDAQTRKADSGREYQVDTLVIWDGGPPNLRVMVRVDDGGWSAIWATVKDSFIKAPDGSFVGE